MSAPKLASLWVIAACATGALGQHSFWTVALSNAATDGDTYNEVSISVSKTNPLHLMVACNFQKPPYMQNDRWVYYGISTTGIVGALPWSERGELPVPPGYSGTAWQWFDPMTAASQTSDTLWVGCVFRPDPIPVATAGFAVWRNPAGTGTLSLSGASVIDPLAGPKDDKGMIAVGPDRGNQGAETMYMGFTRVNYPDRNDSLMWRKSTNGTPGAGWSHPETRILPQNASAPLYGFGAMPVVQPTSAGADAGRLIMVYEQPSALNHSDLTKIEVCRNVSPELSQEEFWEPAIKLDKEYGQPSDPLIHPVFGSEAFIGTLVVGQHPSICRDPANPNRVWVSFIGSETPYPTPGDQNVDIYVARITYGTPSTPNDVRVQRITDAMLGDISSGLFVNGSDQFFPAITVDAYGGVNLAYLRMPHSPPTDPEVTPPIDVTYVRIAQFPVPPATSLTTYRLTPLYSVFPESSPRIGDYISIDTSGCAVYIAYPKVEPGNVRCNTYVTRVTICAADVDSTGLVDTNDVVAFGQGFSQGTQSTDMNHDGVHTGTDLECFLNYYTCGCAQQP